VERRALIIPSVRGLEDVGGRALWKVKVEGMEATQWKEWKR
jgi:hypothetical protein